MTPDLMMTSCCLLEEVLAPSYWVSFVGRVRLLGTQSLAVLAILHLSNHYSLYRRHL